MMSYEDFLNRVIEDGKSAVKADYAKPVDKDRLEGALEGFEACRGRSYSDMPNLLSEAEKRAQEAFLSDSGGYWRERCRAAEIEWVCNVVSAAMIRTGHSPIVPPTARG